MTRVVNLRQRLLVGRFTNFVAVRCLFAIIASACLVGCNNGVAMVGGTVTLDGKAVEGGPDLYGTVSFYREGGGGAPAIGIIKDSGKYTVSTGSQVGMEPGSYLVGVSVKKILPSATPDGLPTAQQVSPRKYIAPADSGFKAEVKPGSNTFDFALQSK